MLILPNQCLCLIKWGRNHNLNKFYKPLATWEAYQENATALLIKYIDILKIFCCRGLLEWITREP